MKKIVSHEINICDFCNTQTAYYECRGCKKDICFDCQEKEGIRYTHDAFFCHPCDAMATDKIHKAYLAIHRLKEQWKQINAAMEEKRKAAELTLDQLLHPL